METRRREDTYPGSNGTQTLPGAAAERYQQQPPSPRTPPLLSGDTGQASVGLRVSTAQGVAFSGTSGAEGPLPPVRHGLCRAARGSELSPTPCGTGHPPFRLGRELGFRATGTQPTGPLPGAALGVPEARSGGRTWDPMPPAWVGRGGRAWGARRGPREGRTPSQLGASFTNKGFTRWLGSRLAPLLALLVDARGRPPPDPVPQ